jgi:hypothetical protein
MLLFRVFNILRGFKNCLPIRSAFKLGWESSSVDFGRLDPDPDPGGQKWPTKLLERWNNIMIWSAGSSLLRAEEGFSCSMDVLHGGMSSVGWIRIRIMTTLWGKDLYIKG